MLGTEESGTAGQWRSEPPTHCLFQPSASITGVVFTGRHAEYKGADTGYPSWAADGYLYPVTAGMPQIRHVPAGD